MRMSHLILSDIGPFRGTHTIDLTAEGEQNGFAFFGQNGRGKTTIYNAMKWCLWGEVRTRVRASMGERLPSRKRPIVGPSDDILMNREAYRTTTAGDVCDAPSRGSERGHPSAERLGRAARCPAPTSISKWFSP